MRTLITDDEPERFPAAYSTETAMTGATTTTNVTAFVRFERVMAEDPEPYRTTAYVGESMRGIEQSE